MTYATLEASVDDGQPFELIQFSYGAQYFRYTSEREVVSFLGNDFNPYPIERSEIKAKTTFDSATVRIRAFRDIGVGGLFKIQPPSSVVLVTVWSKHRDDPDEEYAVEYTGRVLSCSWEDDQAVFECEPATVSMKRPGLRRPYQKPCPLTLYRCGVRKEDFAVTGALALVSGSTVSLVGAELKEENWFAGGYLEYVNAETGATELRAIESSSGANLVLMFPAVGLATTGTAYAGCAHNTAMCISKFNNLPNYGGQPTIPTKNPFGGTDIF